MEGELASLALQRQLHPPRATKVRESTLEQMKSQWRTMCSMRTYTVFVVIFRCNSFYERLHAICFLSVCFFNSKVVEYSLGTGVWVLRPLREESGGAQDSALGARRDLVKVLRMMCMCIYIREGLSY